MDNISTPDMSSGQASSVAQSNPTSSPDVISGQGANNSSSQQAQSQSKDWQSEFQRQANHANQKITELAQANAQYKAEMEALRQSQEQQKQALLQALGGGTQQQQQQVDYFEQFATNPNSIVELINQRAKEIAAQEIQPISEKIARAEVNEFLTQADATKNYLRENLSKQYDPKIVEQVMDFSDVLNPKIVQLNNQFVNAAPEQKAQIQAQLTTELAREIQSRGGIEAIVEMKLGRFLMNNQESLLRSAAQIMQQNSYAAARSKGIPGFNNNSGGQASFGTGIRSESIYR